MPARTSGGRRDNQTRTPLLEFSAVADFRYSLPNVSRAAAQEGRGGARYLTNSEQFANQVAGGQSGSVPHPPYPPPPALPVAGALGGLRLQRQADAVPVAVAGAGQQRRHPDLPAGVQRTARRRGSRGVLRAGGHRHLSHQRPGQGLSVVDRTARAAGVGRGGRPRPARNPTRYRDLAGRHGGRAGRRVGTSTEPAIPERCAAAAAAGAPAHRRAAACLVAASHTAATGRAGARRGAGRARRGEPLPQ